MISIALVGCGRIAQRHSELLGSGLVGGARLAAVCDRRIEKAKEIAVRHKVPAFGDMDEMMQNCRPIDVVSILTPSGLHAEHAMRLAKYGCHLIVEKPMALTLEDADAMIKECTERGIRMFVVKQNRFNVPVLKLREAIEEGRFGKLVLGTVRVRWCRTQEYYDAAEWRGTWALDGGVLTNQASHHIDLLEWLLGDVESVFAKSVTALVDIEAEDTGVAILKFKNGALGVIEATTATRPKDLEGSISILGEKGSVVVGGFAVNEMEVWQFTEPQIGDAEILKKFSTNPPDVYGFGHKAYYEHVVDCIQKNRKALVDGLEGRKSLELITAMYESIETGKEVRMRFAPRLCRLGQK